MGYASNCASDTLQKRLESCFAKKGSLPSEEEVKSALEICTLKDPLDKIYEPLDKVLDEASSMISSDNFWPAVSFTYDPSQEGVKLELKDGVGSHNSIDTILQTSITDPTLADEMCRGKTVLSTWNNYTRGYKMLSGMRYTVTTELNEWQEEQINFLYNQARNKGYIKKRDQFELADEITRRQEQFPGDRIYTFIGDELGDYYQKIYGDERSTWRGSYLIHHGHRWGTKFDNHESMVLAKSQVVTSQKNTGAWVCQRESRRWRYAFGVVHKFKIELADYPGNNRRIIKDCQMKNLF